MAKLVALLIAAIHALGDTFRHSESAAEHERGAEDRRDNNKVCVLQISKAEADRRRANDQRAERYERKMWQLGVATFIVSMLTLVAVGWYACVAQRQLNTTIAQFHATERPWLQVAEIKVRRDFSATQPRKEGKRYVFDLDFMVKNVGKSPAFILDVYAEQIHRDEEFTGRKDVMCVKARERARQVRDAKAWTVLPNGEILFSGDAGPSQKDATEINGREEYRPSIIGCVVYQSLTAPGVQHSTPFVGNVTAEGPCGKVWLRSRVPVKLGAENPDLCILNVATTGKAD